MANYLSQKDIQLICDDSDINRFVLKKCMINMGCEVDGKNMEYHGLIIGFAGCVDDRSVKKCFAVGMDGVVFEPFDQYYSYVHQNKE